MGSRWPLSNAPLFDLDGRLAPGARITFFEAGTTTPMAVYRDAGETTPHSRPVIASAVGVAPLVFVPYRPYGVRVTTRGGVLVFAEDDVPNFPPPEQGGGGGLAVTPDQIFQTGDVMWQPRTGTRNGWVRYNARTIGNANSGASERANADTAALFAFLWNTLDNAICPVSGGRSASPSVDFAASKTLQLPDLRGLSPIGLDDMGNNAVANRIQVATNLTTSLNSKAATVTSAAGLAIGMTVISANVPAGTTLTDIAGTAITLSNNATAAAANIAARFSLFSDPQVPGRRAGAHTHLQAGKEVGAHDHTGTTNSTGAHAHTYSLAGGAALELGTGPSGTSGFNSHSTVNTGSGGAHQHTLNINNNAAALPMPNLQPSVTGTYYGKL